MAKVKLLLDEDVQLDLASALRKRGYEATHVQELGRNSICQGTIWKDYLAKLNYY